MCLAYTFRELLFHSTQFLRGPRHSIYHHQLQVNVASRQSTGRNISGFVSRGNHSIFHWRSCCAQVGLQPPPSFIAEVDGGWTVVWSSKSHGMQSSAIMASIFNRQVTQRRLPSFALRIRILPRASPSPSSHDSARFRLHAAIIFSCDCLLPTGDERCSWSLADHMGTACTHELMKWRCTQLGFRYIITSVQLKNMRIVQISESWGYHPPNAQCRRHWSGGR